MPSLSRLSPEGTREADQEVIGYAAGRDGRGGSQIVISDSGRLAYPDGTLAGQSSKRRSRKRRNPRAAPRAVASQRREQRAERDTTATRQQQRAQRQLGTEGERPPSPFGGVPVSEIAIFAGLVALVVWFFSRGSVGLLIVGLAVCALGVLEVTAREHFSGYRSHTMLLAAIPAIAAGIGVVSLIGRRTDRAPLLLAIAVPIFAFLFWLLRKRFQIARQARVARPPSA
jgi:hypothetical protein